MALIFKRWPFRFVVKIFIFKSFLVLLLVSWSQGSKNVTPISNIEYVPTKPTDVVLFMHS